MKQKSQVTLFIVIIVAIILVLLFFLVSTGLITGFSEKFKTINDAEQEVKHAMQECLKMEAEEALKLIALQGRVYPQDFFTYKNINVYYANNPVTKQQLENEIGSYISQN